MAEHTPTIRICKWGEFQHYKQRTPPWIKLHRSLLSQREWYELSGDASKLLAECWLLASEHDGEIPIPTAELAWRLRRDDQVETARLLEELARHGFIDISEHDASDVLSRRYHDAIPETEAEEETEGSASSLTNVRSEPGAGRQTEEPAAEMSAADYEAALHALRSEAAGIIRKRYWQGPDPPTGVVRKHGRWTMGRELSIWDDLVEQHAGEFTAEEVNGGLSVVREALEFDDDVPLSLLLFNVEGRRDRLRTCVHFWRKLQAEEATGEAAGGLRRAEVSVPAGGA